MSEIVCYHGFLELHASVRLRRAGSRSGRFKLAERMWGDRFQVIVATHLNYRLPALITLL